MTTDLSCCYFLTHCRVSDVCASMQKDLPKVAGNSNRLYLSNVFFDDLCTNESIHLLTSNSLELLFIINSTISRNNWNRLTTAIAASSGLKQLITINIGISFDSVMDLVKVLKQTKTLEEVTVIECEADFHITMLLLIGTMPEISVKRMFIGHSPSNNCDLRQLKVAYEEDVPYEGGRLLTINLFQ